MKTFGFTTDFSQNARNALAFAVPFVQKMGGRLLLIHIYEWPDPYVEVPAYIQEELIEKKKQAALEQLESWKKEVNDIAPDLSCTYLAMGGSLIKKMNLIMEEGKVDWVIMGTHGASGLKKVLVGSNTAQLIQKAVCPVLVIPETSHFQEIQSLVFMTDFQGEQSEALDTLIELDQTFHPKIVFLHVATEPATVDLNTYDWYQEEVARRFPSEHISFEVINAEEIHKGIKKFLDENDPGIVVMVRQKKNWMDRAFKGSVTREQVHITQRPLLILPGEVSVERVED